MSLYDLALNRAHLLIRDNNIDLSKLNLPLYIEQNLRLLLSCTRGGFGLPRHYPTSSSFFNNHLTVRCTIEYKHLQSSNKHSIIINRIPYALITKSNRNSEHYKM